MESERMFMVRSDSLSSEITSELMRCQQSLAFADVTIVCDTDPDDPDPDEEQGLLRAHGLVLAAVSPLLREALLSSMERTGDEGCLLVVPDCSRRQLGFLLDVVYSGMVEGTVDELRSLVDMAELLAIEIPVTHSMIDDLDQPNEEGDSRMSHSFHSRQKNSKRMSGSKARLNNFHKTMATPVNKVAKETESIVKRVMSQSCHMAASTSMLPSPPPLKRQKGNSNNNNNNVSQKTMKELWCSVCFRSLPNSAALEEHRRSHEADHYKDKLAEMLNEVITLCYDSKTSTYNCQICNSNYSHSGNFKQHLGKHERESGAVSALFGHQLPPMPSVNPSGRSKPVLGGNTLDSLGKKKSANLPVVLNSNGSNLFHCQVCGRTFKHSGNFKQHMNSHMRVSAIWPNEQPHIKTENANNHNCDVCDDVFTDQESLQTHRSVKHGLAPSNTQIILANNASSTSSLSLPKKSNKSFAIKNNLFGLGTSKMGVSTPNKFGKKPFGLKSGGSSFSTKKGAAGFGGSKNIASSFGSGFGSKKSGFGGSKPASGRSSVKDYWDAIVNETEEMRRAAMGQVTLHECKFCKKRFADHNRLLAHMRCHKYPCPICKKFFTRPQHVQRHMLLHTGEKPYKCDLCGKHFNREDKLKEHTSKDCDASNDSSGRESGDDNEAGDNNENSDDDGQYNNEVDNDEDDYENEERGNDDDYDDDDADVDEDNEDGNDEEDEEDYEAMDPSQIKEEIDDSN